MLTGSRSLVSWLERGMPVLAIAEVDQALARLDADHGEISANLAELERHPGVRFLDEVPLTGDSAARWADARVRLDTLWTRLRLFESVSAQAHRVRARRPRPGAGELAELTTLLCDASVTLAPQPIPLAQRGLLGPAAVSRALTLTQLVAEMTADYREVARLAGLGDTVFSEILPQVDRAGDRLRELRELAADPGLTGMAAAALARLDAAEARLNAERALAMSDPLTLAAREPGDTLTGELDAVHRLLRELLDRRDELRGRIRAYRVKAARTGLTEDPGIDARYRRAYELLHSTPCDLDAAAHAVTEYQQAITEKTATR